MAPLAIVSALEVDVERALLEGLLDAGHDIVERCAAADLVERTRAAGAAVGLVPADAVTPAFIAASDAAMVRVVAVARGHDDRRIAIDAGLFEVVDIAEGWPGVAERIDVGLEPGPRERRPIAPSFGGVDPGAPTLDQRVVPVGAGGERGRVIAVWGPVGAPGRTTVAVNLAAELAAGGAGVCLVDADTYGASVANRLGLLDEAPGLAIACRAAATGDLDTAELERIAQTTGAAPFHVLAGLTRVSRWPELAPARIRAVLDACRAWVDVTVVDVGFCLEDDEGLLSDVQAPSRNGAAVAVLLDSDAVVAVGSADPVGVSRLLRGHLELAELVEPERISVVVNRLRGSAIGLAPGAQVERTLRRFGGIESVRMLPDDPAAADESVLAGTPLVECAPRSKLRRAIELLADPTAADRGRRSRPRGIAALLR